MDLRLQVGAAETTINPRLGMQIDGNIGAYRPAQVILNDLYARAVKRMIKLPKNRKVKIPTF